MDETLCYLAAVGYPNTGPYPDGMCSIFNKPDHQKTSPIKTTRPSRDRKHQTIDRENRTRRNNSFGQNNKRTVEAAAKIQLMRLLRDATLD